MNSMTSRPDRSAWAVAGGLMMGLGAGFFFLRESVFAFVGCLLLGIGVGLVIAAIVSRNN